MAQITVRDYRGNSTQVNVEDCHFCCGAPHVRQLSGLKDKCDVFYVECECGMRTPLTNNLKTAIDMWNRSNKALNNFKGPIIENPNISLGEMKRIQPPSKKAVAPSETDMPKRKRRSSEEVAKEKALKAKQQKEAKEALLAKKRKEQEEKIRKQKEKEAAKLKKQMEAIKKQYNSLIGSTTHRTSR